MTAQVLGRRIVVLALAVLFGASFAFAQEWPSFRGPGARGVVDRQDLPAEWSVAGGKNVRWKAAIPGLGHSSPIVAGDRVFITSAVTAEAVKLTLGDEGGIGLADDRAPYSWRLFCLSARDGRVLWEKEAATGLPRAKRHVKASQANATPATDGRTVVALFGSEGLFAFDFTGRVLWRRDLGVLNPGLLSDATSEWGHASSPVIHGNQVVVQVDRHQDSYLAALDLATGKDVWRVARDERPVWSTPTLVTAAGRTDLVVIGGHYVRGYDPATGKELWRFKDEAEVKTPTPFASDGLLVLAGGYRGRPILALKPGAVGDISVADDAKSGPFLAWRTEPGGPYTSTPVAYRGLLYSVRDEGILSVFDLATGQRIYQQRTNGTHAASLLASDGKVYVTAEGGEVTVVKAGRTFEVLARNDMGETCMATPAIANRTLFVRTRGHVYAIGATKAAGS
jgi:outer membrane protein assembly factor BamB